MASEYMVIVETRGNAGRVDTHEAGPFTRRDADRQGGLAKKMAGFLRVQVVLAEQDVDADE